MGERVRLGIEHEVDVALAETGSRPWCGDGRRGESPAGRASRRARARRWGRRRTRRTRCRRTPAPAAARTARRGAWPRPPARRWPGAAQRPAPRGTAARACPSLAVWRTGAARKIVVEDLERQRPGIAGAQHRLEEAGEVEPWPGKQRKCRLQDSGSRVSFGASASCTKKMRGRAAKRSAPGRRRSPRCGNCRGSGRDADGSPDRRGARRGRTC